MPKMDAETRQLLRYLDSEVNGEDVIAVIPHKNERQRIAATFIQRQLQQAGKIKETRLQRSLRKNAMEACLEAIRVRKDECYCYPKANAETRAVPGAPSKLCTACMRAQEALRVWLQVEHLITKRMEIQREYFSAVCNAKALAPTEAVPPEKIPLKPSTVVKAIEVTRAMQAEEHADNAAKQTG